ncbi:hypothetical protein F220043C3_16880 [Enterocloster asparagiformis]|uniref:InlB B-repeat-containing protein n=1 Tax=Enterocloster asparagiformis TaxID=333367 RepID=UPI0034B5FE04
MKGKKKQLLAILLAAAMAVTQTPGVAMAKTDVPEDGSIASFAALDKGTAKQKVPFGTELSELDLPDTLEVKIYQVEEKTKAEDEDLSADAEKEEAGQRDETNDGETEIQVTTFRDMVDVSWDSEPEYDGDLSGKYVFTAEADGYDLADGVNLPKITVTVLEEETEEETGAETGEETEEETGAEAGEETEEETGAETGEETEEETGAGTEEESEEETGAETGEETEEETGAETEAETEEETSAEVIQETMEETKPDTKVEEIDLMSLLPEELEAIDGYNLNDVAIINSIIEDTGLEGYQTNRPDEWDFVTWKETDNGKQVQELMLEEKGMTGVLDISGLTELTELNCENNELTALIGVNIPKLDEFHCRNNLLEQMELSGVNNTIFLMRLSNNNFTELELPFDSYINDLDVSHNPQLRKLSINARVRGLDIDNNPELAEVNYREAVCRSLNCENTQLTEIGVSWACIGLFTSGSQISRIRFYESADEAYTSYFNHTVGGTIDINIGSLVGGTNLALTAIPEEGCTFQKWLGLPSNAEGSATDMTVLLPRDSTYSWTVTAVFSPEDEDADGDNYHDGDVAVFQALLEQHPELNVNPDSPAEWETNGLVVWDSKLPKRIGRLNLSGKNLSGVLDISGLPCLTDLSCKDNSLTELNLSSLPELKRLDCGANQLETLSMSGLSALQNLTCDGNQIKELNISQLPKLNALYCTGNPFERLITQKGELAISQREGGTVTIASFLPLTDRISLTASDPDADHTFNGWWAEGVTLADASANPVSFILDGDIGITPLYTPTENAAAVDLATKEVRAADFTVKQETANTEESLKTWIVDKTNGLPGMKVANVTVDSDSVSLTEGSLRMAVQGDSQNPHGTDGSFQFDVTLKKVSPVLIKELNGTITATPYVESADQKAVNDAKGIIGGATYMVDQNTANTQDAVKNWLVETINATEGMSGTGITFSAGDITFTSGGFRAAVAGDSGRPGTDGSFRFTVKLAKGFAQTEAGPKDGTITATVYGGKTDLELVTEAKEAFEGSGDALYTIGQETANTGETVQEWLARMIEGLPGIYETGISVTAADITLTDFQPAVEGSAITPAGTNGGFRFKVSFTKGSQSLVSGERSGIITARAYAVQNDQQAVDVAKAVIENSASAYMVRQATANTLSEVQAWLVETVNALPGIKAAGITVGAGDISMEQQSFQPAEAGNAATYTGTDGGFRFTVSLSKGGASVETNMTSGIITATPYTGQTDQQSVDAAKAAIENSGSSIYTADQASANTEGDVKVWLAGRINDLPGMNTAGISVKAEDFTITPGSFRAAASGTLENPAGTNGSFRFNVSLHRGNVNETTTEKEGTIIAMPYSGQSDWQILELLKGIIEGGGALYTAEQGAANTEDAIKSWLAETINALPGLKNSGVVITAGDIIFTDNSFHAAVSGTPENPNGTNGSFLFTVTLAKDGIQDVTGEINGSITAARYSGGSGSSSGGSGGSSGGSSGGGGSASRPAGTTSADAKKGMVNTLTGIITGTGDGYSSWNQDNTGWKLRYADGTFASGTIAAAADGSTYEQPAWEMINGAWYAFGADGYAKNGLVPDPALGGYFYIDINSGMKTGWQLIDGQWRYFNPLSDGKKGIMIEDAWIDGWYVDKNGVWNGEAKKES